MVGRTLLNYFLQRIGLEAALRWHLARSGLSSSILSQLANQLKESEFVCSATVKIFWLILYNTCTYEYMLLYAPLSHTHTLMCTHKHASKIICDHHLVSKELGTLRRTVINPTFIMFIVYSFYRNGLDGAFTWCSVIVSSNLICSAVEVFTQTEMFPFCYV